jgi:hypothetical protein
MGDRIENSELKQGYQPRSNLLKNDKGNSFETSHRILKKFLTSSIKYKNVNDVS